MSKSNGLGLVGALFALIGIKAITQHELAPAIVTFILAIGCALRARDKGTPTIPEGLIGEKHPADNKN